jgi:hypothetical protein
MFLKGATYPLELLCSARQLAAEAKLRLGDDGRTTPMERALARGAIFTAFNFLESLLIELSQECLRDSAVDPVAKTEIEAALSKGRASISWTIKKWPSKLGKKAVHGLSEYKNFNKIRRLRNNLTHPKLHPLKPNELTQDQLIQEANAERAAWVLGEITKMAQALYRGFGSAVPPEVL